MNVLAIDTSVGVSVAILRSSGELTQSEAVDHGMQGELTAVLISQVVADSGIEISEITDVVVGVGPGHLRDCELGSLRPGFLHMPETFQFMAFAH